MTDDQGATSPATTETINVASVNDAPNATPSAAIDNEDTIIAVSLGGTDIDGTITSVKVTALPANGTLFLNDGVTPIVAGSTFTPAEAASLKFVPTANFNGSTSFTFTVTDDQGATSPAATETINVATSVCLSGTCSKKDVRVDIDEHMHVVKLGINYRFGMPGW